MINIQNLNKNFGKQILFDDLNFQINHKEKIGLVGRNGYGKTTLLNIMAGLENISEGTLQIPKEYSIGYVKQELIFKEKNILDEVIKELPKEEEADIWKAEKILSGLGFTDEDMEKPAKIFSGGFQVRINLAKTLVKDCDLLLLDEPNNYLDIVSIKWLENFLATWTKELVLITHNRFFMDKVVSHIAGIYRQKVIKIKGSTKNFYERVKRDEETFEKQRVNEEKKIKKTELFINKFRAKARLAGLTQSRMKALAKLEPKKKLEKIKDLTFSFNYKNFSAKQMLNAKDITFSYDKQKEPLIKNFNLSIENSDRIFIIGKNGKGKTTLLKLLSENLSMDKGKIALNPQVEKSYYEQSNLDSLNPLNTIIEELFSVSPSTSIQLPRDVAANMLFEQDEALKKVKVLSGGEKNRVALGKILLKPSNLLFLDEPTNHLDLESSEALLNALKEFQGAIVMVTHNELFLHKLAKKIVFFKNDGEIEVLNLTYNDFLKKVGWEEEPKKTAQKQTTQKEIKKEKAFLINQKSKELRPIQNKIKQIENKIEAVENEIETLNQNLIEEVTNQNSEKIQKISKTLHLHKKKSETLIEELEKEILLLESKEEHYNQKLLELDGVR